MKNLRAARTTRRLAAIEALESRIALSADGLTWGNAPYLSISFAPDGTEIDGNSNQLFASMETIATEGVWQEAIVDAFQTWAHETNGDIFVTSDSGDDFGIQGRTVGDDRFGDIRIGAIPLRNEVFAIGVSRGFVAGTWSGDVLFNSELFSANAANPIASIDDVLRIAMHEAGHVYGFDDSTDPNHVMHDTGIPQVSQPSAAELDELWARFGMRSPDINERSESNDVPENGDATHMYSSDSGFDGSTPLIHHGDIGRNDVDYFRFDNLEAPFYVGDVTFEVRTSGLSQLQPAAIEIRGDDGVVVPSRLSNIDADGSDGRVAVTLRISPGDDDRYFVGIRSDSTGINGVGGYALVTTFDGLVASDPIATERLTSNQFRFLEGDDIQDVFAAGPNGDVTPFFRDDFHTNDFLGAATILEPVPGFEDGVKYELLASISNLIDIDYYTFQSADFGTLGTDNVMTFLLESFESPGFEPIIDVFDATGAIVEYKQLLRHDGSRVIQVSNLDQAADYFLRVGGDLNSQINTGSYRVSMRGGVNEQDLELWKADSTSAGHREFVYFASRPELTMFALQGLGIPGDKLMVTVASLGGALVTQFGTPTNQFRSTNSVLLPRGAYRVRIESSGGGDVPFELLKATLTDPLAVIFIDVQQTPVYHVDDVDDVFVFPGGPAGGGTEFQTPPLPRHVVIDSMIHAVHELDEQSSTETQGGPEFGLLSRSEPS